VQVQHRVVPSYGKHTRHDRLHPSRGPSVWDKTVHVTASLQS